MVYRAGTISQVTSALNVLPHARALLELLPSVTVKSGLPADGTMAAAVIYTIGDLHRPGCLIDYPRRGGGAVIAAMVRRGKEDGVCGRSSVI